MMAFTLGPPFNIISETFCMPFRAHLFVWFAGRPIFLEGPPGSGKTALVDELAARTGNASSMIRLHIDDQASIRTFHLLSHVSELLSYCES